MIRYVNEDIFSSDAQTIVNPVNTVGVMGKGLALAFKQRFPDTMHLAYLSACRRGLLAPGKLMLFPFDNYWVLPFPTKKDWHEPSRLEYIEAGLKKFVETYAEKGITSIAFPKIGCGCGSLSWEEVKPLMERYLNPLPIPVCVCL